MADHTNRLTMKSIVAQHPSLTPKARILGEYIVNHPRKAVFMTTKELARTCQVSEATVVRFVSQLGYEGYGAFQQALRDFVDRELTMLERTDMAAGVMPSMRDACPSVAGLPADNFSFNSLERP